MKNQIATVALAALAAIGSASAFADSFDYNTEAQRLPVTTSSLTRAQVRADYLQALKDGTLVRESEVGVASATSFKSEHTRAEVKAEAAYANRHPAKVLNPGA